VLLVAATLVVGLGFAISSIFRMVTAGLGDNTQEFTSHHTVLVATGPISNNISLEMRPSPALEQKLRRFSGVATVSREIGLGIGVRNSEFIGVSASDDPWLPFHMIAGRKNRAAFDRGAALVGPVLARERGLKPGSTIRLPGKNGIVDVPVLGVWLDGNFGGRNVWVPMSLLTKIYGPQPPNDLTVRAAQGVAPDELARRIEAAHLDPFLVAYTPAKLDENVAHDAASFAQPFWALQRGMMLVAFAAVLFTLLLAGIQRRREMGLVAAVGMPPGGLARLVLVEALAVSAAGTVLGAVLGLAIIHSFRSIGFLFLPFRFPFRVDATGLVVYGAITTLVLLAAAGLPAWRNSRLQVVDAIRYE
jgi:putative ABC transport system permease protein